MPELPEVETSVRGISSIKNKIIESIKVNQPSLRWKVDCQKLDQFQEKKVDLIKREDVAVASDQRLVSLGMKFFPGRYIYPKKKNFLHIMYYFYSEL